MALDNPALANNPYFNGKAPRVGETATAQQLRDLYDRPAAPEPQVAGQQPAAGYGQVPPQQPPVVPAAERISYDNVIVTTTGLFAVVLIGAAVGWFVPALMLPGAIVGLVLGLVNSFKRKPSPALIIGYGVAEGLFIGAASRVFELLYPGVVMQAVLATLCTFGVTLALFASGKIRASAKATKVFMIAMFGYLAFSLVNFGIMLFGGSDAAFGLRSAEIMGIPLGVIIGILVVLMAAYSLVLDFDFVQNAVRSGAPKQLAWTAAFGLVVTIVWLYVEFLRLFAILQSSDN